jgi:hypothetical protein
VNQLLEPHTSSPDWTSADVGRLYSLYGMTLRSDIPLAFAETSGSGAPDVRISRESAYFFADARAAFAAPSTGNWWYHHATLADGSVYVCVPDYCEFVVSADGTAIACGLIDESSAEWFRAYLVGIALSFALIKQGCEPLHATVVVLDGKGVAFLGESGWGKSTLAASFVQAGYRVLTDDLLLIRDIEGALHGFPGPPRVKLFPATVRQLQPDKAFDEAGVPDSEKVILPLGRHEVHASPVPMDGFFVLDEPADGSGVSIRPLSRAESLVTLVGATFNRRLRQADRLQRQFAAASEWSSRLPVQRLIYPRKMELLDRVRDAILADVRGR